MPTLFKKICLIGNYGVGKTSLIRQFVENQFSDEYHTTIGVKISRKDVEIQDEGKITGVQLIIWDLEGRKDLKSITIQNLENQYLTGAHGAVIVGDLTRSETITSIPRHIDNFLAVNPQGCTIVALNKTDLVDPSASLKSAAVKESDSAIATYRTSAKTGECVNEIFEVLAHHLVTEKTK